MGLSDYAIITTPKQFKDVCHNLRDRFDVLAEAYTLSQLQQQLAKALGFSCYQALRLNDHIIVESERLLQALDSQTSKLDKSIQQSIHDAFFESQPFLIIDYGWTLQAEVRGLDSDECYVDSFPTKCDGQGLYRLGSTFVELAPAGMISEEAWDKFVVATNEALENSTWTDADSQLDIISESFTNVACENFSEYLYAGDLLMHYPEIYEELRQDGITRSKMLKILASWYCPEVHRGTPLHSIIEFCEQEYLESVG